MKTYEVCGPFGFNAHAPGSTFQADPDDPTIQRSCSWNCIREVADTTPAKPDGRADTKSKEDIK